MPREADHHSDPEREPNSDASKKARKRKTYPLRLSPSLYEELRAWAEQEMRSVNGQIEFLLRDAIRRRKKK